VYVSRRRRLRRRMTISVRHISSLPIVGAIVQRCIDPP
jgi:hypothetical protein